MKWWKTKVPTYFILDEFANIGQIPDFDKRYQRVEVEGYLLVLFYKTWINWKLYMRNHMKQ